MAPRGYTVQMYRVCVWQWWWGLSLSPGQRTSTFVNVDAGGGAKRDSPFVSLKMLLGSGVPHEHPSPPRGYLPFCTPTQKVSPRVLGGAQSQRSLT